MPDFAVSAAIRAVDKLSGVFHDMGDAVGKFGTKAGDAMDHANKKASLFRQMLGANIVGNLVTKGLEKTGELLKEIPKQIEEFAGKAQELGRTATIVGTSASNWQRWAYAAKMTDTNVDGLQSSMQKLNRNMAELTVGKGTLMDLAKYGPPGLARQIKATHDTSEATLLLADAMQKTKDPQVRAAIATAAFGKAGQDLIPLLAQGRSGIHALMKEADRYGSILDDKVVEAGGRVDDTMKRLRGTIGAVKDQVLSFVLQAVAPYLEKATEWIADHKELIATKIDQFITKGAAAFKSLLPIFQAVLKLVGWLLDHKIVILAVYAGWLAAQIALNIAMDANPIGLITLAIEALIAVVIVVITYWKQITGALQSAWNWFNKLFGNPWIANALYFIASPIWLIIAAVRTLVDLFQGKGWKSFQNLIPPWAKGIAKAFGMKDDASAGMWGKQEQAPAAGRPGVNVSVPVNVDNSRAPGVSSTVRSAPAITGLSGVQFAGAVH